MEYQDLTIDLRSTESGFEARIAEDNNRLAFAMACVVPRLVQHLQLRFATDKGRQLPFGAQLPTRTPTIYFSDLVKVLVLGEARHHRGRQRSHADEAAGR